MSRRAPGEGRPDILVTVLAVTVVLVFAMIAVVWYVGRDNERTEFTAQFTASVGLYPGSDVRMLGVKVGTVDAITPKGTYVDVRGHLDPGYAATADTEAVIFSPSLVSDRYVQLTKVWTSGARLADGAVIPVDRTATPVELDQLYGSVLSLTDALGPNGANRNGAVSDVLDVGAQNLEGNGREFNQAIDALADLSSTGATNKDALFATLDNLSVFTKTLADRDGQVADVNAKLASVTDLLAGERQTLSAALSQLATALDQVQGFIADNRQALTDSLDALVPTVQVLSQQRQSLEKAITAAPLLVSNLLDAYDPARNLLVGRGNLNELSIWASGATAGTTSAAAAATSGPVGATGGANRLPAGGPPLLLPTVGSTP